MNAAKHAAHDRPVPVHWLLVSLFAIYGVALVVVGLLSGGDDGAVGAGLTTAGCLWGGGSLLVVAALLAAAAKKPGLQ